MCFICSLISILDWGACKPCKFLCFCVLYYYYYYYLFCYTSFVKVKITFWHFIVWLWIWSFIAIIIQLNCICIAQVHHKSRLKVICKERQQSENPDEWRSAMVGRKNSLLALRDHPTEWGSKIHYVNMQLFLIHLFVLLCELFPLSEQWCLWIYMLSEREANL